MKEFNLETKIIDLDKDLSRRVISGLMNENITDVRQLLSHTPQELLRVPNFGKKSLKELEDYLAKRDMRLGSIPKPKPKKEPKPKGPQWFWANEIKPEDCKKQVLFYTYQGECFVGIFSRELGWMTPLPQNNRQNWDTLIRVTASVMKWAHIPSPDYDRGFFLP
jgi:hypothetical protein